MQVLLQLAAFLTSHHHVHIAAQLAGMSTKQYHHWFEWALSRGFQPIAE